MHPFGDGGVRVDPRDGAVVAVTHPRRPGMSYLLDEATEPWHTAEHRRGGGFAIHDGGGARWAGPGGHELAGGLVLRTALGAATR